MYRYGLSLAIELAAARTKLFLPQALQSRLDRRLTLLTGGARDLPPRQQTLRTAIDWSYSLLDVNVQTLFLQLGAFVGGWNLLSAQAVCSTSEVPIDVLASMTQLVDHSLVQQYSGREGEPRFTLLETVREYALERLAARGEMETAQQRHAAFFLEWVEQIEPLLYGAEQDGLFDQIELELPNIRTAIASAYREGRTHQALRFAVALGRFWYIRGYINEGRRWFDQVLIGVNDAPLALRTKALIQAADLAKTQNDLERVVALSKEAIALCEQDGNTTDHALALHSLAEVAIWQGDVASARTIIEEAVSLLRVVRDMWMLSTALFQCGFIAELQHDRKAAHSCAEECLALLQAQGDRWSCAGPLFIFGRLAFGEGDYATARTYNEKSVRLWREVNDRPGIRWGVRSLGLAALLQKDLNTAWHSFIEGMMISHQMGDEDGYALCLMGLAGTLAAHKQPDQALRAARLYGAAERIHGDRPSRPYPDERIAYEQELSAARALLGETAFATIYGEGQALSDEQVIAYVKTEENHIP